MSADAVLLLGQEKPRQAKKERGEGRKREEDQEATEKVRSCE